MSVNVVEHDANVASPRRQFQPGFRISLIDVIVIAVGTVAAIALWSITWWMGFVVAFVIAHFFLFCNVFRVARPLELVWSGVFIVLTYTTVTYTVPPWPVNIVAILCVTAAVIARTMHKSSYHGILWKRVNPGLPDWWAAQSSTSE